MPAGARTRKGCRSEGVNPKPRQGGTPCSSPTVDSAVNSWVQSAFNSSVNSTPCISPTVESAVNSCRRERERERERE